MIGALLLLSAVSLQEYVVAKFKEPDPPNFDRSEIVRCPAGNFKIRYEMKVDAQDVQITALEFNGIGVDKRSLSIANASLPVRKARWIRFTSCNSDPETRKIQIMVDFYYDGKASWKAFEFGEGGIRALP